MSDNVNVSGPIEIKDNSKERVALDLLKIINSYESQSDHEKKRSYYLTLYSQCLKATSGYSLESPLKEE